MAGLSTDSPTYAKAAKCATKSGLYFSRAPRTSTESRISHSIRGPQRTASRQPRERLSIVTTFQPALANALQQWEPTYPAPPVTNTVFVMLPHRRGSHSARPQNKQSFLRDHRATPRTATRRASRALVQCRADVASDHRSEARRI